MLGCTVKLSNQDKQEISHLTKENTELRKRNVGLKKENEAVKKNNTELIKDNRGLKDENDRPFPPQQPHSEIKSPKPPKPDKIFRVGDKLPSFTFNDVTDSSISMATVGSDATFGFFDGIYWVGGILTVQGVKYGPSVIAISDKKAWIELKDGTRYVCLTEGGCVISQEDYIIIRGEIKVSYKNSSK